MGRNRLGTTRLPIPTSFIPNRNQRVLLLDLSSLFLYYTCVKERTCVSRFIEKSQRAFAENSSLKEVFSTVPHYKDLVARAYRDRAMSKNFVHNLATSTVGLKSLAVYEFLRHKGLPLPDANTAIQIILPAKKRFAYSLLGEKNTVDSRMEEVDFADATK